MPNRLFFLDDTTNAARAYNFSRTRESADDITLDDVVWKGIVASDDRLYFLGGNRGYAYDFGGTRRASDDITFTGGNPTGGVASDDRMYFIVGSTALAYDFDRNRQSADDIAVGGGIRGAVASNNRLYFVNNGANSAQAYDFDGARQSTDDISLPSAGWQGGVASSDRLYFISFTGMMGVAFDFSGTRQSSDDISLGTGSWQGGTSIFETTPANPNTPSNFGASAGARGIINLSWDANTDTVTGYQFRRATSQARLTSATWNNAGTGTTYADSNLQDSTTYYYQLRAVNNALQSDATRAVSATTAAAPPVRPVATSLEIVSGNAQSAEVSTALANPLVVRVLDQNGNALQGVSVGFSTTGGALSGATATTDSNGHASVTLTLPATANTYTITASVSGLTSVRFTATATPAVPEPTGKNRLYFVNDSADTAIAYDFNRVRQSADDISLGTGVWLGAVASPRRIYFLSGRTARAYALDGTRRAVDDITFTSGPKGGAASDDRMYFIVASTAQAYDFRGTRQAADDIDLGSGSWNGGLSNNDRLYFVDNTADVARAYDFDRNRQAADDISLGSGSWHGGAASRDRLYFLNFVTQTAVAYDFEGNAQSTNNISLGIASWRGATSVILPKATLTISTDNPFIIAGETVTINIRADQEIADFVAGDITVTGGTRGALSGSGQNWTLSVVAGSAGTLRIAIAADIVLPGNLAVSRDFTIFAPLAFGATVSDKAYTVGDTATFTLPEATGGIGTKTYSVSSLPTGFSFNPSTRVMTVNASQAVAQTTITYTVRDSDSPTPTTRTLTFDVLVAAGPLTFGGATISDKVYVVGDRDSFTLPAAVGGEGAKTYSVSSLPTGFTFNSATREVTVAPTAVVAETEITYTATDSDTPTPATQTLTFNITVFAALSFGTATIPDKIYVVGDTDSFTLPAATGGIGDKTYSVSNLPTGVTFDPATRVVTVATTAVVAQRTLTYTVRDADTPANTQQLTFDVTVLAALSFGGATITDKRYVIGERGSFTLPEATGGIGTKTYRVSGLPEGFTFNPSNRVITVVTTAILTRTPVTYTATDSETPTPTTRTLTFDITVSDILRVDVVGTPQTLTLYQKPLNRSTTPAEAGDNDYSTSTNQTTIVCDIRDSDNAAQTFDTIFLKCAGVTAYNLFLDGVDQGARFVPERIQIADAEPAIADVSIVRDGWQHDLLETTPQTASRVELRCRGTDIRINEVMVLKKAVGFDRFVSLSHSKTDIDSELKEADDGNEVREIIVGLDRLRWMSSCTIEFAFGDGNYEPFLDFIEDNPEVVVAQDPELYPWRVYRAIFPELQHNAPYICSVLEAGNTVQFRLLENRIISNDPSYLSRRTFNSEDSQQKYLFFNDCRHLNNNRVTRSDGSIDYDATDNDFQTYSEATELTFDVSLENGDPSHTTHIFLKSTGITAYAVQTRIGNTWATQQTVTPDQRTYRGWDNSLVKLDTTLTATQIRLVFTGTDIKIAEVMLLEHAGGLVSMSDLLPIKRDRTGVVQQTQSGTVERTKTEPTSRFKWQLNFSAVFGHNNSHFLEDFLDWINANPNFTFAERAEDKPWRVYPAGFLNSGFNASYVTQTIQIGEMVQCQLSER